MSFTYALDNMEIALEDNPFESKSHIALLGFILGIFYYFGKCWVA